MFLLHSEDYACRTPDLRLSRKSFIKIRKIRVSCWVLSNSRRYSSSIRNILLNILSLPLQKILYPVLYLIYPMKHQERTHQMLWRCPWLFWNLWIWRHASFYATASFYFPPYIDFQCKQVSFYQYPNFIAGFMKIREINCSMCLLITTLTTCIWWFVLQTIAIPEWINQPNLSRIYI